MLLACPGSLKSLHSPVAQTLLLRLISRVAEWLCKPNDEGQEVGCIYRLESDDAGVYLKQSQSRHHAV